MTKEQPADIAAPLAALIRAIDGTYSARYDAEGGITESKRDGNILTYICEECGESGWGAHETNCSRWNIRQALIALRAALEQKP